MPISTHNRQNSGKKSHQNTDSMSPSNLSTSAPSMTVGRSDKSEDPKQKQNRGNETHAYTHAHIEMTMAPAAAPTTKDNATPSSTENAPSSCSVTTTTAAHNFSGASSSPSTSASSHPPNQPQPQPQQSSNRRVLSIGFLLGIIFATVVLSFMDASSPMGKGRRPPSIGKGRNPFLSVVQMRERDPVGDEAGNTLPPPPPSDYQEAQGDERDHESNDNNVLASAASESTPGEFDPHVRKYVPRQEGDLYYDELVNETSGEYIRRRVKTNPPMLDHVEASKLGDKFNFTYTFDNKNLSRSEVLHNNLQKLMDVGIGLLRSKLPPLDGERMKRYVDDRRPAGIFTMVRNEPVILRAWAAHYNKTFIPDDMYILDNNFGRDGMMRVFEAQGINTIPTQCDSYFFDNQCILATVSTFANLMLMAYKTVIYVDGDEFIFSAKPNNQTLWEYLCEFDLPAVVTGTRTPVNTPHPDDRFARDAVRAGNYSLTSISPQFNWNPNVEEGGGFLAAYQREYWYEDFMYRKPLIYTRPLMWIHGFHKANYNKYNIRFDKRTGRVNWVPIEFFDGTWERMVASSGQKGSHKRKKALPHVKHYDGDIVTMHIHRIDKAYFMQKQLWKSQQKKVDAMGFQGFLAGAQAEKFYWEGNKKFVRIPEWWKEVEERHLAQKPTGVCPPRKQ